MAAATGPPSSSLPIPLIELPEDPSSDVQLASKLRGSCQTTGFFYVRVPSSAQETDCDMEEVWRAVAALFSLPDEVKRRLSDSVSNRGYTGWGEESLDGKAFEPKEGYYIGRHIPPTDPRHNPAQFAAANIWPTESDMKGSGMTADRLRTVLTSYFSYLTSLGHRLLRLLAASLDLPMTKEHDSYFAPYFTEPLAVLRLLRYDLRSRPDQDDPVIGAAAHSDYGMLTLLRTDDSPGLQVFLKDKWVDIPPHPMLVNDSINQNDTWIVNLGDMLERWTNGLYASTRHRVVLRKSSSNFRYSMPFFFEPNYTAVVECLPTCRKDGSDPRYPPVTSGEYLLSKYKATHADFRPSDEQQ